ncbi:MAG: hypothetical protein ACLP56_15880, partial [Candidatus Sulfotelmatobacter sp.]
VLRYCSAFLSVRITSPSWVSARLIHGTASAVVIFDECTSTLAVVRRETNSWKWPVVQFVYMTIVAYAAAFAVNQVLSTLLK